MCYIRGNIMNETISIRLSKEEKKIFKEYSKIYGSGLSTMIKQLALEKLHDEFDLAIAERFERGYADGSITIRPYSELLKEMEK